MKETGSHALPATGRSAAGRLRGFVRDKKGATAVEFGFVMFPFAMLLFAIVETALVFFTGQALQTAVADASRLILTGQAQTAYPDLNSFKVQVCNRFPAVPNCTTALALDVQKYTTFGNTNTGTLATTQNGKTTLDPTKGTWCPGNPSDIIVVRAAIAYRVFVPYLGLANLDGGTQRLIQASAVFQNEPFPPTNSPCG